MSCHKHPFPTRSEAMKKKKRLAKKIGQVCSVYLCPHCRMWHCTSQDRERKYTGYYQNIQET